MHEGLVNRLGGLSLPRKSVVRLTDRPDMTLDVYRGRKTTNQQSTTVAFVVLCPIGCLWVTGVCINCDKISYWMRILFNNSYLIVQSLNPFLYKIFHQL